MVVSTRTMHNLTLRVTLVFGLVLVFLLAAIAFGVMRLGLARTTTVLALLDRATLGVDMVKFAVCERGSISAMVSSSILDPDPMQR
jgi:hypothetical protein